MGRVFAAGCIRLPWAVPLKPPRMSHLPRHAGLACVAGWNEPWLHTATDTSAASLLRHTPTEAAPPTGHSAGTLSHSMSSSPPSGDSRTDTPRAPKT